VFAAGRSAGRGSRSRRWDSVSGAGEGRAPDDLGMPLPAQRAAAGTVGRIIDALPAATPTAIPTAIPTGMHTDHRGQFTGYSPSSPQGTRSKLARRVADGAVRGRESSWSPSHRSSWDAAISIAVPNLRYRTVERPCQRSAHMCRGSSRRWT
jgi:hypothetical protein